MLGVDPFKRRDYDYPGELNQPINIQRLEAEGWRYDPSMIPDNPTPKQRRAAEKRHQDFRKALIAVRSKKLELLLDHFGITRRQRLRWEHRWWLLSLALAERYVEGFRYGPPLPRRGRPAEWTPEEFSELEAVANGIRADNPHISKLHSLRLANERLGLGSFATVRRRLSKLRKDELGGK